MRNSFNVVCSSGVKNRHSQLIQFSRTIRLERETKLEKKIPFKSVSEPLNSQWIQYDWSLFFLKIILIKIIMFKKLLMYYL